MKRLKERKISCSLESALILQAMGFRVDIAKLLADVSAIFHGDGGTHYVLFLAFQGLLSYSICQQLVECSQIFSLLSILASSH